MEGYGENVVLITIGRGPPVPPIARYGAIFFATPTQTPSITARIYRAGWDPGEQLNRMAPARRRPQSRRHQHLWIATHDSM